MKQRDGIYVKLLEGGVRGAMHSGLPCKERSCSIDILLTVRRIAQSPNKKSQLLFQSTQVTLLKMYQRLSY
jgi:hypothetical protein